MKTLLADPAIHQALVNAGIAIASLIGALAGVAIRAGTKMLQAKIENEHNALVAAFADRVVKYAEQKFEDKANGLKSDYVSQQLAQKFPGLSPQDAQHFMEQAVVNMQTALAEPATNIAITTPSAPPAAAQGGVQ